jgi:hypothetical protein
VLDTAGVWSIINSIIDHEVEGRGPATCLHTSASHEPPAARSLNMNPCCSYCKKDTVG